MCKKIPYELPDGDFVKYIEQIHKQSLQKALEEKARATACLNAASTTESPQESLRKIRAQHKRTMQSLRAQARGEDRELLQKETSTQAQLNAELQRSIRTSSYNSHPAPNKGRAARLERSSSLEEHNSPTTGKQGNEQNQPVILCNARSTLIVIWIFLNLVFFVGMEDRSQDIGIFVGLLLAIITMGLIFLQITMVRYNRRHSALSSMSSVKNNSD